MSDNNEVSGQVIVPGQNSRQVAAPRETALAVFGMTPCPALSGAVAAARDRCKAAIKRSYNEYHKFAYASADEVIDTANEALEGSGLALLPLEEELVVLGSGTQAFFALNRLLVLTHASGEFAYLRTKGWPVIPERGRPLDKAFSIGLTTSLAYKLRDLLQMPRKADDDVAAQNDRNVHVHPCPQETNAPVAPAAEAHAESPPANPTSAPAALQQQPEYLTELEYDQLVGLSQKCKRSPQEMSAICAALQAPVGKRILRSQFDRAWAMTQEGMISTGLVDRLSALLDQLKIPWEKVGDRLQQLYQVRTLAHLTPSQAQELEGKLRAPKPQPQPQPQQQPVTAA